VPGDMKSQVLIDAACISHFFPGKHSISHSMEQEVINLHLNIADDA
jgi:hypothetical protein